MVDKMVDKIILKTSMEFRSESRPVFLGRQPQSGETIMGVRFGRVWGWGGGGVAPHMWLYCYFSSIEHKPKSTS